MEMFLEWLARLPWSTVAWFVAAENTAICLAVLACGHAAQKWWAGNRIAEPAPPLTTQEVALAASNVFLNSVVTFAGWVMWKNGLLVVRAAGILPVLLDAAVLFVVMDFAMYGLHRLAHHPWLFPWMHAVHHRYDNPRPLTLFVMHPLETLSFGVLWLAVITGISLVAGGISFEGMMIYLTANVVFGLCGHLGVQPFPARLMRLPVVRWLAGSQFHATHHADGSRNFGFYSRLWDSLLKTGDSPGQPLPDRQK